MKYSKLLIVFALFVFGAFTLFAQNAQVSFKDATQTTRGYLNLEYPGGAYPTGTGSAATRWKMVIYKSADDVVDPLVNGLPSGNDVVLTNPDAGNAQVVLNVNLGPTGTLNLSAAVVHASYIPTYIYGRIFNSVDVATATKYMTFTLAYNVTAGAPVNVNIMPAYGWKTDPVWSWIAPPPADTYTYNLTVNGPAGTTVTGPGTYAGAVNTTYTCGPNNTDINDLIGNWTAGAAPVGFHWQTNPIAVAAGDFVAAKTNYVYNATITFVPVADPDVYNYTLHVTGPDGIAVTGPVNGTLDYDATDLDGTMENALLGIYTAGAAPAGFHWTNNPITVTAANFAPAKSAVSVLGSRNNGAKATYNYVATIEFLMEADAPVETWTYNLNVNGPDGYAVTGPVAGTTDYLATDGPGDITNGLLGDYTIAAAPAGFHWAVNPITVVAGDFTGAKTVTDHVYNATIEFVLVENVIDPTNPPAGIVITPGGNNGMPGTDAGLPAVIFTIAASGVWDVVVTQPVGYPTPWYAYINTVPMLASGPIVGPTYTFFNVDFGAKAPLVITLDDDESMTLPVELSYFAATLTAQNFVKLTWVSQSETGLLGYRVYRSENDNQANAISITPSMIAATNTSTTQTYNVVDEEVVIGSTYYYWLESVDMGHSTFFGPTSVLVEGEVPPVLPEYTTMRNAYPNPFRANTNTTIEVSVKAGETGSVTVYNVLGQVVKTFSVKEGMNNLNWNGKDTKGNACGSGIYFYKLSTPSMNMTKKMVIVK